MLELHRKPVSRAAHYCIAFLSFFHYFSEILCLGCFFRQASFLVTKKNHLPKCELERGKGADGGGGARTCLVFENNILLAEGFLSYVLDNKKTPFSNKASNFLL